MKEFWMVYGEGEGAPHRKHPTDVIARREAERLARLNEGRRFYVLRAVADVISSDVAWTNYSEDGVPF